MKANEIQESGEGTAARVSAGRRRRLWPWVGGAILLAALAAGRGLGVRHASAEGVARGREGGAVRAVPVTVASARVGDVPVYLRGLGTATAFNTATVRSRVDGELVRVAVREGQLVTEGQLLAEIDPRPFEVQIEQAEGQLARDRAALKDAQVILDRDQALFDQRILAQQDLDSQQAKVGQLQGAVRSDEAGIHSARLQLSYSRITAPFGGRVGLRLVDRGNMVHANDPGGLMVVTQIHPIAVVFSLPQDDLGQVLPKVRSGVALDVEAYDRDNAHKIATGRLLTVDNQIDTSTGTYKLKAVFDNPDDALYPNQFVNVRLRLDTRRGLVLVPSAALQRGSQGTFVYVVDEGQVAHVRPITVAISESGDLGTSDGLKAAENVVVDGQDKLQDGSKVDLGARGPADASKGDGSGKGRGEAKPEADAKAGGSPQ